MLIHRVRTGYSIAYVNTWGSAPPPADFIQHILLIHLKDKFNRLIDKLQQYDIDESKCNLPIELIQVIFSKTNRKYFTKAGLNSAYNQLPLDEQLGRLTQFVIGNQQYELNRLFY